MRDMATRIISPLLPSKVSVSDNDRRLTRQSTGGTETFEAFCLFSCAGVAGRKERSMRRGVKLDWPGEGTQARMGV